MDNFLNAAANAAFFDPAQVDATFHPLSLRPEPTSYAAANTASHAPSFDAAFAAFFNAFQTSAATYAAFYAASSNALLTNAAAYVATSTGISVAEALSWYFSISVNKICKIMKIFG